MTIEWKISNRKILFTFLIKFKICSTLNCFSCFVSFIFLRHASSYMQIAAEHTDSERTTVRAFHSFSFGKRVGQSGALAHCLLSYSFVNLFKFCASFFSSVSPCRLRAPSVDPLRLRCRRIKCNKCHWQWVIFIGCWMDVYFQIRIGIFVMAFHLQWQPPRWLDSMPKPTVSPPPPSSSASSHASYCHSFLRLLSRSDVVWISQRSRCIRRTRHSMLLWVQRRTWWPRRTINGNRFCRTDKRAGEERTTPSAQIPLNNFFSMFLARVVVERRAAIFRLANTFFIVLRARARSRRVLLRTRPFTSNKWRRIYEIFSEIALALRRVMQSQVHTLPDSGVAMVDKLRWTSFRERRRIPAPTYPFNVDRLVGRILDGQIVRCISPFSFFDRSRARESKQIPIFPSQK